MWELLLRDELLLEDGLLDDLGHEVELLLLELAW